MKDIFVVPCEGVKFIQATDGAVIRNADQQYGNMNILLNNVIYYRDYDEQTGLVHLVGHIDVMLSREYYDKFVLWMDQPLNSLGDIKIIPRQYDEDIDKSLGSLKKLNKKYAIKN